MWEVLMNRILQSVAIIIVIQFGGFLSASAETMKAISFLPKNHPLMSQVNVWVDSINSQLKGKLQINKNKPNHTICKR